MRLSSRARDARARTAYGIVLATLGAAIFFDLASPDTAWGDVVQTSLGIATLATSLLIAGAGRRIALCVAAVGVLALIVAVVRGADPGGVSDTPARFTVLMITALVMFVIGRDIVNHPRVTVRTLLGAISFYLLIGLAFARLYACVAAVDHGHFFVQPGNDSPADYLYFSFVTLTTVGFGDLSAGMRLGRALVVAEALLGQLYLVTIVALFVSNIGRERTPGGDGGGESAPD